MKRLEGNPADFLSTTSYIIDFQWDKSLDNQPASSAPFMTCVHSRTNLSSILIKVGEYPCAPVATHSSLQMKHGRSQKHSPAHVAADLKSNLFSRRDLRKIDVHISSINGFHNSLVWRMCAGQSLSSKLWQVHSQFSWLTDNQISPASVSPGTLWWEQMLISGNHRHEKKGGNANEAVTVWW